MSAKMDEAGRRVSIWIDEEGYNVLLSIADGFERYVFSYRAAYDVAELLHGVDGHQAAIRDSEQARTIHNEVVTVGSVESAVFVSIGKSSLRLSYEQAKEVAMSLRSAAEVSEDLFLRYE